MGAGNPLRNEEGASELAKPLKVDEIWLERIAGLLDNMEFGSLHIVVHEGQIVQMERTERKRFENATRHSGEAVSRRPDSRAAGR
ncbi:hypothetical protein SAMN04487895_107254 [Paenibacillus sophorae]|uniref:DUF2292 domain-containing protein n=1 Tax=Paenibacillus sophorae TaxID=1333845 RepID=A0A1H8PLC2_9BACL|nr:hypothetical protein SAMN04487895_107254 [Paenibacillus sophorae]